MTGLSAFSQYFSTWSSNGYPYYYQTDKKTATTVAVILIVGFLIAVTSFAYVKSKYDNE